MLWLYAILALSALIIIHEFGHYLCARAAGMHVDRFSVLGIGPVVLKLFEWKGTEFVISAIPFGAYVHIVGMEPEEDEKELEKREKEDPEGVAKEREERAAAAERAKEMGYKDFRDASLPGRVLAIFGGPLANYITAMIFAIGVFAFAGVSDGISISKFSPESQADEAGLQVGDVFQRIEGEDVRGANPGGKLIGAISAHPDETIEITVLRGTEEITYDVPVSEGGTLGVGLGEVLVETSFGDALSRGLAYPFVQTKTQLGGLWKMITGKTEGRVGGPVAIARAMKTSAEGGLASFILFAALISTVLGMFNLLPLPALDGGRLVFLGYEVVTGRRPNPNVEGWVHFVGMVGLLGLIGYATVGDLKGTPLKDVMAPYAVERPVEEGEAEAGEAEAEDPEAKAANG